MPLQPSGAPLSDAALARAVSAGDRHAATALWTRYAALVRGVVHRTVGWTDVDDVVQDVFIVLLRKLHRLRDPDALRSFVVGTAIRVGRTELRRRGVRRYVALTETGDAPDALHEGAPDPEARRAVHRLCEVLDEVDDRGRTAFVLRHVEGCELTEVAASLGCSLATTKRSLAKVRERVEAVGREDPWLAAYARRRSGRPA